jgi:hypothetical protein
MIDHNRTLSIDPFQITRGQVPGNAVCETVREGLVFEGFTYAGARVARCGAGGDGGEERCPALGTGEGEGAEDGEAEV